MFEPVLRVWQKTLTPGLEIDDVTLLIFSQQSKHMSISILVPNNATTDTEHHTSPDHAMGRTTPLGAALRPRLHASPTIHAPFFPATFASATTRTRLTFISAVPSRSTRYYTASPALSSSSDAEKKINPSAANPPSTTRPPLLAIPTHDPTASTISHLISTGKAYLNFYKTGLRQIRTNYQLRSSCSIPLASRAANLLAVRSTHDISRLPLFLLLLLVCGEFTPLVVLAVPKIVPYTCRIPKQVDKILGRAEGRRVRVRGEVRWGELDRTKVEGNEGYIARVLEITSPIWDRVGVTLPAGLVRGRVRKRLGWLARDDELLLNAGGVDALEAEEVRLACVDRGIAVLGMEEKSLRALLAWWLELVGDPKLGKGEREGRMAELLLTDPRDWPDV